MAAKISRNPALLPDFLQKIPDQGANRLALFDADGTLWTDDVNDDLTSWCIQRGYLPRADLWEQYLSIYAQDPVKGCAFALKLFAGLPRRQLLTWIDEWWDHHSQRNWVQPVIETLNDLKERGYTTWVVTGTPTELMLPVKRFLAIDEVLGMDFDFAPSAGHGSEEVVTGKVRGIPCAGQGKADKVRSLWRGGEILFSCGNSMMDVPMMELSQGLIWAVYPNEQFLNEARRRQWPILERPADFKEEAKFLRK